MLSYTRKLLEKLRQCTLLAFLRRIGSTPSDFSGVVLMQDTDDNASDEANPPENNVNSSRNATRPSVVPPLAAVQGQKDHKHHLRMLRATTISTTQVGPCDSAAQPQDIVLT
eukprot:3138749-Amphidinium_carterae.1